MLHQTVKQLEGPGNPVVSHEVYMEAFCESLCFPVTDSALILCLEYRCNTWRCSSYFVTKREDKSLILRMVEVENRKSLLSILSSLGLPWNSCCTGQAYYLTYCFQVSVIYG